MRFSAKVRPNQLDGDDAVDEHVAGSINDAHSALADARLEPIATGDDLAKRGIVRPLTRSPSPWGRWLCHVSDPNLG
jgi:hypothetical protein